MESNVPLIRHPALRAAAALLLGALLVGATQPAPGNGADAAIRETTERLRDEIGRNRAAYQSDPAKFRAMVDEVVVPRFDSRMIGRHVLGRHWRAASEAQRERFIQAFKNSLVHSYAEALLKYADTIETRWKPLRGAADADDVTVHADLIRRDGPPIPIGFAAHRVDGDWKVYDVIIEGVSLATTFRGQFNAEVKQKGLDALIARLEGGDKPVPDEALPQKSSQR